MAYRNLTKQRLTELIEKGERNFDNSTFARQDFYAHLCNMDLSGLSFKGANLSRTCFYKSNLKDTDLRASSLFGSYFQKANLTNTNLKGTTLSHSDLRYSILNNANLEKSAMCLVTFTGAQGIGEALLNDSYMCTSVMTKEQKQTILSKYKLVSGPVKTSTHSVPHIRVGHDDKKNAPEDPFFVVGARSKVEALSVVTRK